MIIQMFNVQSAPGFILVGHLHLLTPQERRRVNFLSQLNVPFFKSAIKEGTPPSFYALIDDRLTYDVEGLIKHTTTSTTTITTTTTTTTEMKTTTTTETVPMTTTTILTTTIITTTHDFIQLINKNDYLLKKMELNNKELYMTKLMRRLVNFNKLLEEKVSKFNRSLATVYPKRRIVFLMVTEDLVKIYVERYEKRQKVKHITSIFKLMATTALLSLGISLLYIKYRMLKSMKLIYEAVKVGKQKRKRHRKKIKK